MTTLRGPLLALVTAALWVAAPAAGSAQDPASSAGPPATPPSVAPPPARTDSACVGCPRKSLVMAVLGGLATNVFINRVDAWVLNVHDPVDGYWARVSPRSWSASIRKGWVWDNDAFRTNMILHPWQGGSYFRAGRFNGLDFWESVPLTFLGSAEWEYFGETTKPSLNDFYNTGFGGIVMGETIYRLVSLIRDNQARGVGRFLRELAAFPLDPTGAVKRLLSGELWRVYTNPGEHAPPLLALQVQAGGRLAPDSGVSGARFLKGVVVAELGYGDAFATPYTRPFDVFLARALISPGANPVGEFRVAGRLYGHEFTSPSAPVRAIFTVKQKIEYTENPAYKFGGQSLEAGLVAGFGLGRAVEVRTEGFAEGIMLGAVDAQGAPVPAGEPGTPRTYDFGPGVGIDVAATVTVNHFPVFAARYHWSMVHSVSGSPADHFTHLPSVEVALPLTRVFGLGAHASWYARRSAYAGRPGEVQTYPDFRAYLVWRTRPRPAAPEPQ